MLLAYTGKSRSQVRLRALRRASSTDCLLYGTGLGTLPNSLSDMRGFVSSGEPFFVHV